MNTSKIKSQEFLKIANQFKLGKLTTESRHPLTMNLSKLSHDNLPKAIQILKDVDLSIFQTLKDNLELIYKLQREIQKVISNGNKIFFTGCGSTGRLSLTLEFLWRSTCNPQNIDQVIGIMAGGDNALISAIENFEDHPEFAVRQLEELNFSNDDLLIGSSEGGETPFVIGSINHAKNHSTHSPWFVYCNPDHELLNIERSQKILQDKNINKLNLSVGPMAISGSTRMQASSVILFALGLALLSSPFEIKEKILSLEQQYLKLNLDFLNELIIAESNHYKDGGYINYATNDLGITILTDTTERAPTFNLAPFENILAPSDTFSLTYLDILEEDTIQNAWEKLLLRKPRCLNWNEYPQTSDKQLLGFNISNTIFSQRPHPLEIFTIEQQNKNIYFQLKNISHSINVSNLTELEQHILLKMILNIHSTLVMGRLDRYHGNLMTWVRPSCNKLIDRAIRYILHLLEDKNIKKSYDEVCLILFQEMDKISPNEPIVIRTFNSIISSL